MAILTPCLLLFIFCHEPSSPTFFIIVPCHFNPPGLHKHKIPVKPTRSESRSTICFIFNMYDLYMCKAVKRDGHRCVYLISAT